MSTQNSKEGSWNNVPAGTLNAVEIKLFGRELGNQGERVITQLHTDQKFLHKAGQFLLCGGIEPSIDQRIVRAIMGKNYFGPDDWVKFYNASFTKKQLRAVTEFPWGEDILSSSCPFYQGKLVRDTHFAFLGISRLNGVPLTVAKWLELHPATGQPKFKFSQNPWHAGQPYADEATMELKWYLMLKDIIPNSTNKIPEERVAILPAEYEVPTTIAEVTKNILVFRKTGNRPNPSRWAACTERTVKTNTAGAAYVSCVGNFDENGLNVNNWNGNRNDAVGVGAARKYPKQISNTWGLVSTFANATVDRPLVLR